MLESTRAFLNQPDPNNSFWTDVELVDYLNEAVRIHMAELSSVDEGQGATTVTLDIVQNVDTIALPTDFFFARGLWKITSQQNVLMTYRNNLTESYATNGGGTSETYVPSYGFRGNNIVLRPAPNFSETGGLLLEYVQMPAMLQDGADTVTNQICAMFFQSIRAYAIYLAKLKESLNASVAVHANAETHFANLFKQFRELSQKRSKRPTSVVPFDI